MCRENKCFLEVNNKGIDIPYKKMFNVDNKDYISRLLTHYLSTLYPLKTSENLRFFYVFREHKSETLVENGIETGFHI